MLAVLSRPDSMTGTATVAAILSFARQSGNGKSGKNLPFRGKYLSNLLG